MTAPNLLFCSHSFPWVCDTPIQWVKCSWVIWNLSFTESWDIHPRITTGLPIPGISLQMCANSSYMEKWWDFHSLSAVILCNMARVQPSCRTQTVLSPECNSDSCILPFILTTLPIPHCAVSLSLQNKVRGKGNSYPGVTSQVIKRKSLWVVL